METQGNRRSGSRLGGGFASLAVIQEALARAAGPERATNLPRVRVKRWADGSYGISVADRTKNTFALVEGSPTRARAVHVNGSEWRETRVEPVVVPQGVANAVVQVAVDTGGVLSGQARTLYPNGVRRVDSATLAKGLSEGGHRAVWNLPDGGVAEVAWGLDGHHEVVVPGANGAIRRLLHTTTTGTGENVTRMLSPSGEELGSVTSGFDLTGALSSRSSAVAGNTVVGHDHQIYSSALGRESVETETYQSGKVVETSTWVGQDASGVQLTTLLPDGRMTMDGYATLPLDEGGTATVTYSSEKEAGGSGASSMSYEVKDNETGVTQGFSVGTNRTGEPVKTSTVDDGQGHSSQTSVTYHEDESFTINTVTKDADGQSTTDQHTYDKQGDEVPPPSGDGDEHDGHEHDGDETSMPAYDDGSSPPDEFGVDFGPLLSGGSGVTGQLYKLLFEHGRGWQPGGPVMTGTGFDSLEDLQGAIRDRLTSGITSDDGGLGGGDLGRDTGMTGSGPGVIFDQAVEVPLVLGRDQWYDPDRPEAMIAIVDKFAGPEAAKTARLAFEGP